VVKESLGKSTACTLYIKVYNIPETTSFLNEKKLDIGKTVKIRFTLCFWVGKSGRNYSI
jgi:hypothetical protein